MSQVHIQNPLTLLQWAISTGRVPASDYDLWVSRLTATAGVDYWTDYLLNLPAGGGTEYIPHQ